MHDTNLDYFFLIHFLACYLEAFFFVLNQMNVLKENLHS